MFKPRRERQYRKLHTQPLLFLIPNILTIMGLCAGMTAIRYALDGRFELAVTLIGAAVVLDGLDGRSARMLNLTSKLGAQLDSLADFLSFGVAPAMLIYLWTLHDVRGLGWSIGMLYAVCCALRLARFNSELENPNQPRWTMYFFTGIPAPGGAALALAPMMLSFVIGDDLPRLWTVNAIFLTFVGMMMVSKVATFSIKKIRVRPNYVLPTLIGAGVLIVLAVTEPWLTLSILCLAYLATIPFSIHQARRFKQVDVVGEPAPDVPLPDEPTPETGVDRVVSMERRAPKT